MAAGNTERLYRIETLIRQQGHVSMATLRAELEVSRATLKRDLEFLRSRMGAPIEYDAQLRAYRFGQAYAGQAKHELPGLWFDQSELHALLTAQQVLAGLDSGGLLSRHLQPLLDRIKRLLASGQGGPAPSRQVAGDGGAQREPTLQAAEAVLQRVKIVSALRRPVPSRHFERVSQALMARRRLQLVYLTRGRGEVGEREVSPQRLVHYRNTWYLDAWCHRVGGLRRFALDAMQQSQLLPAAAQELPLSEVQAAMDAGYGIYAGGEEQSALLLFNPQAAQWASREEWHPKQQGRWREDGSYEMRLPFVDRTELMMDLLRQGPEVKVLEPASLALALRERLRQTAALYDDTPPATAA